jgi:N-acetyl-beta-hexosaminidase
MAIYDIDGNELVTESKINVPFWSNQINTPYWILHLDCARKYFSVANVKTLIDLMASAGFNQLQLHFSEDQGFRLQLDDMIIKANGTTYDLVPCLGGTESSNKWYSQTDMDNIISYAHGKGIDIVPSFDMPAHMGRILSKFTQFKLNNSNTINIKDKNAVNFAKALANAYSSYFASRGCKYYNMGYDEIIGWNNGFHVLYNNGEFQYVVDFANDIIEIIKKNGMIPRLFNEPVHYNNDFSFFVNRDCEILYWVAQMSNETLASAETLQKLGYSIINSRGKYYWVLGDTSRQGSAETLANANLLVEYIGGDLTKNGNGAQFCIWCDSTTTQAGDNGNGVVESITPLIAAFGTAISNAMDAL